MCYTPLYTQHASLCAIPPYTPSMPPYVPYLPICLPEGVCTGYLSLYGSLRGMYGVYYSLYASLRVNVRYEPRRPLCPPKPLRTVHILLFSSHNPRLFSRFEQKVRFKRSRAASLTTRFTVGQDCSALNFCPFLTVLSRKC